MVNTKLVLYAAGNGMKVGVAMVRDGLAGMIVLAPSVIAIVAVVAEVTKKPSNAPEPVLIVAVAVIAVYVPTAGAWLIIAD